MQTCKQLKINYIQYYVTYIPIIYIVRAVLRKSFEIIVSQPKVLNFNINFVDYMIVVFIVFFSRIFGIEFPCSNFTKFNTNFGCLEINFLIIYFVQVSRNVIKLRQSRYCDLTETSALTEFFFLGSAKIRLSRMTFCSLFGLGRIKKFFFVTSVQVTIPLTKRFNLNHMYD